MFYNMFCCTKSGEPLPAHRETYLKMKEQSLKTFVCCLLLASLTGCAFGAIHTAPIIVIGVPQSRSLRTSALSAATM